MSVVAVWADGGSVVMAADTRASGGPAVAEGRIWPGAAKVARVKVGRDEALIGAVGTQGTADLTRWHSYPVPPSDGDAAALDRWAYAVSGSLRDACFERGCTYRDDGEDRVDGAWLLAFRGRAWNLTELSAPPVDRFTAIGTGGEVALGVLEALHGQVGTALTPTEVLYRAVKAAITHNATCGGPVSVELLT